MKKLLGISLILFIVISGLHIGVDGNSSVAIATTATVKAIKAEAVQLNRNSTVLYVGETDRLYYDIIPLSAADTTTVKWTTSNNQIVTVNKDGKITAKKTGKATITAKTNNGKSAKCIVTVTRAPKIDQKIVWKQINIAGDLWDTNDHGKTAKTIESADFNGDGIIEVMTITTKNEGGGDFGHWSATINIGGKEAKIPQIDIGGVDEYCIIDLDKRDKYLDIITRSYDFKFYSHDIYNIVGTGDQYVIWRYNGSTILKSKTIKSVDSLQVLGKGSIIYRAYTFKSINFNTGKYEVTAKWVKKNVTSDLRLIDPK